jgi:hypothetical protein
MEIPEMTNPLGKYWEQPDRNEIKFSFGRAWVSKKVFNSLKQYDVTNPSGVYEGKIWRRKIHVRDGKRLIPRDLLCWYVDSKKEGFCDIKTIHLMIDEKVNTI